LEGDQELSDSRFEELVNTHGRDVLNVAVRILRDADLAKDVYQEVFLAIWRRWDSYGAGVNWGPYLYRVTVRKALELARARRLVPATLGDCEPAGAGTDPDARLRLDELQQRLTRSLAKLPRRQARCSSFRGSRAWTMARSPKSCVVRGTAFACRCIGPSENWPAR